MSRTRLMRSLEAREEALRLKEQALQREEEALARAQESTRQQAVLHLDYAHWTSQMVAQKQPGSGSTPYMHVAGPQQVSTTMSDSPIVAGGGSWGEAARPGGAPLPRPARLPPMEVEASQTPYTARHGQLRSAENPSYEGPQQHHNLDSESSSPTLAPQVMLATDGSLLLMSGKEGGKPGGTHVFKVERAGDASASKSRRGMQLQERVGEKRVVSSSAMEDEDGGTGDEGRRGAGGSEGDEDEDEDEDGYASAASRDDERSRPSIESKNTHTRKSRFPKMPKAVPKVHVTRTVKVHKLNEMGEIVDKRGHRAWEMACGLQLGVRVMVSVNCQKAAEPDFDAFQQHVKFKFPSGGSSITPPHDGPSFKFKDYAPIIFRNLREMFSIDTADYLVALCNTQDDGSNALRIMGTPGKSGSLFFFSHDMRFIIKTLPKREAVLLREILPAYYQHVKQNPGTYLPRFYGLYRWKHEFTRKNVRFVVMNNVFATPLAIHKRYDLKGSTLGRHASSSERSKGNRAIFKDLDLLESKDKIKLGPMRKKAVLDQIRCDCHLLMSLKIMDFSLLLGVHDRSQEIRENPIDPRKPQSITSTMPNNSGIIVRTSEDRTYGKHELGKNELCYFDSSANLFGVEHLNDGAFNPAGIEGAKHDGSPTGERYFLGIIDILMLYTRRKKMERVWKSLTGGEGGQGVSSQPPPKYAIRFCNFLDAVIE